MSEGFKDPELKGIYVKRCKCGSRPYKDRIALGQPIYYIACNCGKMGEGDLDESVAIDNWNKEKLVY